MKLSILSRLILGYFVILILAANMSIYAIVQLGRVNDVTRSIIMVDNPLIGLHKDLTDALLSETRYEKKYLIVQDPTLYDGFLKSEADFEHALAEAERLNITDEERTALNNASDYHMIYDSLFRDELGYLKDGAKYASAWYAEEKDRAVNSAIDELSKVRFLSQSGIFDKVKNLTEAGTYARTFAMVVSGISLLVGLVLSILITRSITRPLAEMQKKTKDIAEGVFEPDLHLPSPPEIGELSRAINSMCSKLKEVDKMKSDFFALMSHELRTPLTAIKEGTNLFLEGKGGEVTEKQKKLLTIISQESNRLIGLVNSVLDLSKLESGMLMFNFTRTDLPPLISRVVAEMGPLAEAKHVRIDCQVTDLPPLSMDSERMLQVLRNLIANALKFTPRNGAVSIAGHREENFVVVSVSDTGPGIPEEYLSGVFEKFRQAPGNSKLQGTGLGLAIVKHIIQSHGGTVWAQSEESRGSTFMFRLPV